MSLLLHNLSLLFYRRYYHVTIIIHLSLLYYHCYIISTFHFSIITIHLIFASFQRYYSIIINLILDCIITIIIFIAFYYSSHYHIICLLSILLYTVNYHTLYFITLSSLFTPFHFFSLPQFHQE